MKFRFFVMLSIVVIIWGSSFTFLKLGLEDIPPITLAFLRFLLATPFFVVSTYWQNRTIFHNAILREWKLLVLLGLTSITLYHTFQNVGLLFTSASSSSLIIAANPIFIIVLAHWHLHETITWKQAIGVAVAFVGVILIIGPGNLLLNLSGVIGDLLSLGAGLSWACYVVLSKNLLHHYGAQRITLFSMLFGTVFLLPIVLVSETPTLPTSLWLWTLLAFLSILCSGVAYFLWNKALENVSTTQGSVFLFFLPAVSILFAKIILAETFDITFMVGGLLVMVGVLIIEKVDSHTITDRFSPKTTTNPVTRNVSSERMGT